MSSGGMPAIFAMNTKAMYVCCHLVQVCAGKSFIANLFIGNVIVLHGVIYSPVHSIHGNAFANNVLGNVG